MHRDVIAMELTAEERTFSCDMATPSPASKLRWKLARQVRESKPCRWTPANSNA